MAKKMEASGKPLQKSDSMSSLGSEERDNIYYVGPNSVRLKFINWGHVFYAKYVPFLVGWTLFCSVLLFLHQFLEVQFAQSAAEAFKEAVGQATTTAGVDDQIKQVQSHMTALYVAMGWKWTLLMAMATVWYWGSRRPIYLLDFATFQPPEDWKVSHADISRVAQRDGNYTEDSIEFMERLLTRSGTGNATHWPPGLIEGKKSTEMARLETEVVLTGCVEDVLRKTKLKAKDIDILVINCSLFCPTPSMCAMVCNKFGMRHDIESYQLAGMGCSAGVISIHLAKQLLQARPNSTALVISTENITQNMYMGNERKFLVQNTLFRVGGAAIVLSNKWMDGWSKAKYKLLHTVRHQNADKDSYECVYQDEDAENNKGISLSKEITGVAGRALKHNLTTLGPLILPVRELAKVVVTTAARSVCKVLKKKGICDWEVNVHTPDFKKAVQHFCIHAGGRAVIDGIKANLKLSDKQVEPSVSTLYNYGNTSSSSIWYELAFIEKNNPGSLPLNRGDRILQLAFGSGFKCNSAVWVRIS